MTVWDESTNPPELTGAAVVRGEPGDVERLRPLEVGRTQPRCARSSPKRSSSASNKSRHSRRLVV
jgi:hypothetical protein